jgi:hypothetical protein
MRRVRRSTNCENAVVHPILDIQFRSIRSWLCRRFLWWAMGLQKIATNGEFSRAAETFVQTASWAATVPPPFILPFQSSPTTGIDGESNETY